MEQGVLADGDSKPFAVDGRYNADSYLAYMAEGRGLSGQPTGGAGDGLFCLGLILAGGFLFLSGAAIQTQRGVYNMCADTRCIDDVAVLQAPSLASVSYYSCILV